MSVDLVLARMQSALQVRDMDALAEKLGKDVSTFRVWRTRGKVPAGVLNQVSRETGKTVSWLLAEDDEAAHRPTEAPPPNFFARKAKQVNRRDADDELVYVPELRVLVGAGPGDEVHEEDIVKWYPFPRSWLQQKGVCIDRLVMARSNGDSMVPTIGDGELILIDRSVDQLSNDGIYCIEHLNRVQCKRLSLEWDGGLLVVSDNERYPPKLLTPEQAEGIRVVGRVIV